MEYDENEDPEQRVISLQQAINKLLNDQHETYTTLFYLNENLRRVHASGLDNAKQHMETNHILRGILSSVHTNTQTIPVKAMLVSGAVSAGIMWCLLRILGAA